MHSACTRFITGAEIGLRADALLSVKIKDCKRVLDLEACLHAREVQDGLHICEQTHHLAVSTAILDKMLRSLTASALS